MRFHPELHIRQMAGRLHWPHLHWPHPMQHRREERPRRDQAHWHSLQEDAEVAKATLYVSAVTLVILLVVLAAIAFGQEAMHWLGVH
ncbi:hypothetical protein AB4Z48_06015 [Cupriavidus sp. 2TAF22]|uniref:hypothetical protein n=1 Tax=unclassified Cupriavidus TaxID=2640874 RepID=UPI003F8F0D5C